MTAALSLLWPPKRPFDVGISASTLLRTLFLCVLYSLPAVDAQCPPVSAPCICTPSIYEPVSILCDNAGSLAGVIAAISVAKENRIDGLSIINTPIPVLPANSFQGFTISSLRLNRNQLTQIESQAFEGPMLDSLTELDLKDNQLGVVPQTGITALKVLKKLSLSKNRISNVQPQAFQSYEARRVLEKLDLSNNQLSDLSQTALSGLSALKEISLEKNLFSYIPSAALQEQRQILENLNVGINSIPDVPLNALDFPNLKSLSLEYNLLSYISPEAFRGCPNLLYLYVGGNKFSQFDPEMFRHIARLKILGIGANSIQVIPENAFQYIPNLEQLEMQEASVNQIAQGAFQRVHNIKVIVLSRNQLTRIRADTFQGLGQLYSLNLKGNKLNHVENGAWANLRSLRHLDISTNELEWLDANTFDNTLLPGGDRRTLFIYENPWTCDERIDWFRAWLRQNMDMTIDTSMSRAICVKPNWLNNWPIRQPNPVTATPFTVPPPQSDSPTEQFRNYPTETGRISYLWWIILAIILAILLTSICLLALVRYFVSRRRRREKDQEEEERILRSSVVSNYHNQMTTQSVAGTPYPGSMVDLNLPPATSYDLETARPNYYQL